MAAAAEDVPPTETAVIVRNSVVEKQTKMGIHEAARTSRFTWTSPSGYRR